MLKLGRTRRQTGEAFVDPTAMMKQMRGFATFDSLVNTLTLTNHPEDGRGTAQMGSPTIKLITSW